MKRKKLLVLVLGCILLTALAALVVQAKRTTNSSSDVQAQQTITVPFKGRIEENGSVELMLRLYNQAEGGAKLYEASRTAEVSNGIFVAFEQVPSEILDANPVVWVEFAKASAPGKALAERYGFTMRRPEGGESTDAVAVDVSVCFTCGGEWPIFSGAIFTPNGGAAERGSGCSGGIVFQSDTYPYVCSR